MKGKIVVIGSGLGGLSSGVFLAKGGYDVTILEQSHQMGGCLQCFQRHGVKFETGMHFIGSTSEGQALRKLMRALEIDDKIQLAPLNPNAYDVVSLGGKQYGFANGREAFIEKMASYFPGQRTNLERYWDLVENVANSSSLHTLRFDQAQNVLEMEYQMRPMDQVIDSVITDPTLAKVLAGTLPLYAAEKENSLQHPCLYHGLLQQQCRQGGKRERYHRESTQASAGKYGDASSATRRPRESCVMTQKP